MDAVSSSPAGNERVTIPEFQRRLVWNQKKRKGLIDSIKRGYPFGSILIYEDIADGKTAADGKKHYKLIDGLQRTQALKSYIENRNVYFTRADMEKEFVDSVAKYLDRNTEESKDKIHQTVVEWVKSKKSYEQQDGWRTGDLIGALIKKVLGYARPENQYKNSLFELNDRPDLVKLLGQFLDKVSGEVKLVLDAKIPVLVYSGHPSELPTVFELLNSKGTVLSRYEIFAAQWMGVRQQISNREVLRMIWDKYEALEGEGFTLDVSEEAPDDESRIKRDYTLFDYLFGLGHFLAEKYPQLFKPVKDDRPSSVGFNLLTACMVLPLNTMENLPDAIRGLPWSDLEKCLIESTKFVDNILKPMLSIPQYGRKAAPIYHSELMIISMVATAFQARYSKKDLVEIDSWKTNRDKLKRKLPMFYLYEILHDDWRGSGDSKLYNTVKGLRYVDTAAPTAERWKQVLDDWYYQHKEALVHTKEAKRHIRDSRPEYLLLKYIFAEAMKSAKTYHVEHIMPVSLLQSRMKASDEWPINTIGNLALLKQAGQLRNNHETYIVMLQEQRRRGKISAAEQERQARDYERDLICPASLLPDPLTKDSFEIFLLNRFMRLKDEFIRVWRDHIPDGA